MQEVTGMAAGSAVEIEHAEQTIEPEGTEEPARHGDDPRDEKRLMHRPIRRAAIPCSDEPRDESGGPRRGEDAERADHPRQVEARRLRALQGELVSGGRAGVPGQPAAGEADKQDERLQSHGRAGERKGSAQRAARRRVRLIRGILRGGRQLVADANRAMR